MEDHDRITISGAGGKSASAGTRSGHVSRRSRSERAVLDAAHELLGESGFGSLTIGGAAAQAGAARTTIYCRYRSRADLALAVLIEGVSDVNSQPYVEDTATELVLLVNRTIHLISTTLWGRVMKGLVSEIAANAEFVQVYREQVVSKRVADVRLLMERGIARGGLRPGLDPEMVTDLLLGPIYHRLFLSGSSLNEGFGKRFVITLLFVFTAQWAAKWSLGSPRLQCNK